MIAEGPVVVNFGTVDLLIWSGQHSVVLTPSASADMKVRRNRQSRLMSIEEVSISLANQLGRERRGLPLASDMVAALRFVLKEYPHVFG